jgi:hypothetical protein
MSTQTVSAQLEQYVNELANLDDSELMIELGRRLVETNNEIASTRILTTAQPMGASLDTAQLAGPLDVLERAAKLFLNRFNQQLYSLVCNPKDPDNPVIRGALESGPQNLGLVLGGILVTSFGWLPGIATVIAAIILKRIVKAGYSTVCEVWKEQL